MDIVSPQIGIDIAKDELVVSIDQGKPFALPNTDKGCLELASRIPKNSTVHLEATGGYERLVRRILTEAGIKVVLHNPLKARRIAQGQGTKAKTDQVDAKGLSKNGALMPEKDIKSMTRQQLTDHSRAIDVLRDIVADHKKRMKMPELDAQARKIYAKSIADLQRQITKEEDAFDKRIKASEHAQEYLNIQSVPALGKVTARVCVCEFPEDLQQASTAQMSSYAGLAPIDDSSGKGPVKTKIGQGNARLKKAFYMPAICALRTQKCARALYARLRAKGYKHQKAIVPVMRRLLVRAAAVAKRGSPWEDEPHKH
jgi:transposase